MQPGTSIWPICSCRAEPFRTSLIHCDACAGGARNVHFTRAAGGVRFVLALGLTGVALVALGVGPRRQRRRGPRRNDPW
jgi:hypothetical protein